MAEIHRSVSGRLARRREYSSMQNDTVIIIRLIFAGLFALTLLAGVYLVNNYERLFGVDPNMPSENDSSRTYSKMQVIVIWAHAFVLTGAFALFLS
jgi:hypothetical protein